jgi:hypothetical protein
MIVRLFMQVRIIWIDARSVKPHAARRSPADDRAAG